MGRAWPRRGATGESGGARQSRRSAGHSETVIVVNILLAVLDITQHHYRHDRTA